MEDFKALMYYRSKRVAASTIPGEREFMNHTVLMIMFNLVGCNEVQIAFHRLELPALELS